MTATKQPAHEDAQEAAKRTVEKLNQITNDLNPGEARGPAGKRENNPTPPEDRVAGPGPASTAALDAAAGAVAAAGANLQAQATADARLKSDPRYERDQKVYELGQAGKLGYVPPSPAAVAASGVKPEVLEELPKTPEEQVAQDMPRLEQAERKAAETSGASTVQPGEQDGAPQNNLTKAVAAGANTGQRAPEEKDKSGANKDVIK
jgi:hypothetical protein